MGQRDWFQWNTLRKKAVDEIHDEDDDQFKIMRDSIAVQNDEALLIRHDTYLYRCNFIIVTDRYYTFQFA